LGCLALVWLVPYYDVGLSAEWRSSAGVSFASTESAANKRPLLKHLPAYLASVAPVTIASHPLTNGPSLVGRPVVIGQRKRRLSGSERLHHELPIGALGTTRGAH